MPPTTVSLRGIFKSWRLCIVSVLVHAMTALWQYSSMVKAMNYHVEGPGPFEASFSHSFPPFFFPPFSPFIFFLTSFFSPPLFILSSLIFMSSPLHACMLSSTT